MADEKEKEEMVEDEPSVLEAEESAEVEEEEGEESEETGKDTSDEPPEPSEPFDALGLIRDNQKERRKAQEAKAEAERFKAELERLKSGATDGDDILTKGDLEASLAAERRKLDNERVEESEEAAREKHTEAKEGKGLDYDTVSRAFVRMTRNGRDQDLVNHILNSKNPGETMYNYVLRNHPDFIKRVQIRTNAGGTRRLSSLAKEADVPGGSSKSEVRGSVRDPYKMSAAELRKDLGIDENE